MTILYRGYNQLNILGSQYHIIYHGHLKFLELSVKLTKYNPFSEEICHTVQETLK